MRNYKTKVCPRCGEEYLPVGSHQKYCSPCIPVVNVGRKSNWKKDNPEKAKAYMDVWRKENPEKVKEGNAAWKEKNSERYAASNLAWRKTPQGKVALRRGIAKHRLLGWNTLNSWFPNSDGHHINKEDVIYIPVAMHDSVKHNVWTGKNMDKINALAAQYLTEDWT